MRQTTLMRRDAMPRAAPVRDVRRADAPEPAPRPEFVQGVERCFAVIRAFGHDTPTLTITGVSERTGLTRAVARRYLLTLLDLGYLVQRGTQFSMTPRILYPERWVRRGSSRTARRCAAFARRGRDRAGCRDWRARRLPIVGWMIWACRQRA